MVMYTECGREREENLCRLIVEITAGCLYKDMCASVFHLANKVLQTCRCLGSRLTQLCWYVTILSGRYGFSVYHTAKEQPMHVHGYRCRSAAQVFAAPKLAWYCEVSTCLWWEKKLSTREVSRYHLRLKPNQTFKVPWKCFELFLTGEKVWKNWNSRCTTHPFTTSGTSSTRYMYNRGSSVNSTGEQLRGISKCDVDHIASVCTPYKEELWVEQVGQVELQPQKKVINQASNALCAYMP